MKNFGNHFACRKKNDHEKHTASWNENVNKVIQQIATFNKSQDSRKKRRRSPIVWNLTINYNLYVRRNAWAEWQNQIISYSGINPIIHFRMNNTTQQHRISARAALWGESHTPHSRLVIHFSFLFHLTLNCWLYPYIMLCTTVENLFSDDRNEQKVKIKKTYTTQ